MKAEILLIIFSFVFTLSKLNINLEENKTIIMNIYYLNDTNEMVTNISQAIDKNALAYAIYNKSYETTGWDFLAISTYEKSDNKYNDSIKSYAMGYLEGILTKDRIYPYYSNIMNHEFFYQKKEMPENLKEFFQINLEYMEKESLKNMNSDTYWEQVHYLYQQLKGLIDGYNSVADENKTIDIINFQMMAAWADSSDARYYRNDNRPNFENMSISEIKSYIEYNSLCSAIVKLSNDSENIWFGHNTWNKYNYMIRIFKEYHFVSNKGSEKSKTNIFSSYPGTLNSIDDFYYLDSKLLVFETSNTILDMNLFNLINPKQLLTWVRIIIANRLSSSAEDWVQLFQKENSGTYNNQYVILDLNKLDLGNKTLPNNTLMIIEQAPNYFEVNDVTNILEKNKYFASYNVPFSNITLEKLGYNFTLFGDSINYWNNERAKIFKREQNKVNSNEDFKKLLRFNKYEEDEYSNGDPSLSIASRGDLKEGVIKICKGAIDAKFVSVKEFYEKKNIIHIISGPTNDDQPTFSWNNTKCNENNQNLWKHEGEVETWDFPWIDYEIKLIDAKNNSQDNQDNDNKDNENKNNNDNENKKKKFWLILTIIGAAFLVILIIVITLFCAYNKSTYGKIEQNIKKISFKEGDNLYVENEENNDKLIN